MISDDDDVAEVEVMPLSKRIVTPVRGPPPSVKKTPKHVPVYQEPPPKPVNLKAVKAAVKPIAPPPSGSLQKPAEANSYGGLMIGQTPKHSDTSKDRSQPDSTEVNFSKLQGKTYPSLVVFVRPTLIPRENVPNDRPTLDGKVKTVLMYTPAKFTEWLIQQGLVRSEQECHIHPGSPLKLGMYSEVVRFPYSGGYVWISECCKQRFSSVYNGSIFESSTQTPSVLLKLVYHWSCQTNVQNVVQWVKVSNLFIKQFFASLRAVCTVALYNHFGLLGGPGKKIEVGVISLGTSSADGAQRQVKVEVLGIYDPATKQIRLRAVEPLPYSDKVYRKRFLKILEPLVDWVHEDTVILTDLTVDKMTLHNYGFRNVVQANPADVGNNPRAIANSNVTIMDYLRRVVPRMFQNTLSLLNRSMIQQFLDELVWREIFGTTPNTCYDNMFKHISDQTRINQRDRLIARLSKVSANPFKNWKFSSNVQPKLKAASVAPAAVPSPTVTPSRKLTVAPTSSLMKRKRSPPPSPAPRPQPPSRPVPAAVKRPAPTPVLPTPPPAKRAYQKKAPEPVDMVSLEGFYYGIHVPRESEQNQKKDCCEDVVFEVKCPECELTFVTNLELQDHLFDHVAVAPSKYQCRYCFDRYREHDHLMRHIMDMHPIEVSRQGHFYDLICEMKFPSALKLSAHMLRSHYPSELPYRCGCCTFACSSRRMTIDHFYEEHGKSATLMCPLCLQIFVCANREDGALAQNVGAFLAHLREHRGKGVKQCNRCRLQFATMGQLRVHLFMDHGSGFGQTKQLQPISKANTNIPRPKTKVPPTGMETFLRVVEPVDKLTLDVPNGRMCLECGQDFDTTNHIVGRVQCPVCMLQTYCLPFALEHTHRCTLLPRKVLLGQEYYCVCEFSTNEASTLARHMVSCERKTAYVSVEAARENTKQTGVLDGLGLVATEGHAEEDSSMNVTNEVEEGEDGEMATTAAGDGEVGGEVPVDGEEVQEEATQHMDVTTEEGGGLEAPLVDGGGDMGDNTQNYMAPEDYNPNLSLVDLAPTPSVIVQHMPESAVRDDYQDLQTPQALVDYDGEAMVQQHHGGENEMYQDNQHHFQGY